MLMVDARVGPSTIHDLGLIAREFIPQGTMTWSFQPGFDLSLTDEEVQALSPAARAQVEYYGWKSAVEGGGRVMLSSDDDRFTNHSDDPNTRFIGSEAFAVRDIQIGEEITFDYRELGEGVFERHFPNR